MKGDKYFVIYSDEVPLEFTEKSEAQNEINILVATGESKEQIWVIKGRKLELIIEKIKIIE